MFPPAPYAKNPHPDVSSWSGWATFSPKEIRRNWPEDATGAAIACKLSGLLVIDPDRHEHDGVAAWTRLCEENEPDGDWPNTRIIETPTNGLHFHFRNLGNRYGNSSGSLPRGIDVRGGGTGDGGYVLAAGSVVDRRAYEGKPELQALVGDGKTYRVYNDAPVLDLPLWLIGYLERATRPAGSNAANTDTARLWFTAGLTERFGRAVALGRFDFQTAWDELEDAASCMQLDRDEIPGTTKSGLRKVGAL